MNRGPDAWAVRCAGASARATAATKNAARVEMRVSMGSNLNSAMHILDAIGNTSMVRLHRVVPPGCAAIYVKLEWENPPAA